MERIRSVKVFFRQSNGPGTVQLPEAPELRVVNALAWIIDTHFGKVRGSAKNMRMVVRFFNDFQTYLPTSTESDRYYTFHSFRTVMTDWVSYLRNKHQRYMLTHDERDRIPLVDSTLLCTLQKNLDDFCAGSYWNRFYTCDYEQIDQDRAAEIGMMVYYWDNNINGMGFYERLRLYRPLQKLSKVLKERGEPPLEIYDQICTMREEMELALVMCTHTRLGEKSPLAELDPGLLAHIASLVC
jgi:hypothetical protein